MGYVYIVTKVKIMDISVKDAIDIITRIGFDAKKDYAVK